MKSQLFYTAHQLVEAGPKKAVSWFAVACYYHLLDKNELAQRYFLKVGWVGSGARRLPNVRAGGRGRHGRSSTLPAKNRSSRCTSPCLTCVSRRADTTMERLCRDHAPHPHTHTLPDTKANKSGLRSTTKALQGRFGRGESLVVSSVTSCIRPRKCTETTMIPSIAPSPAPDTNCASRVLLGPA